MKPLKLEFEAFGSYLYPVTVNFDELNEHSLFVISGTTGAGKSTIYDAMTYALYGEGNGKGRKERSDLRNQMAEKTRKTRVAFEFALRGKNYRVIREYTTGSDTCSLAVQNSGDWQPVPVENQTMKSYNRKIEELLGISAEQFKQIVILPQGEYEEFLTSDSKEKMKILRSIFNTDAIVKVIDRLKEQVRLMEKAIEQFLSAKKTIQDQWRNRFALSTGSRTYNVSIQQVALDEEWLEATGQDLSDWIQEEKRQSEEATFLRQDTELREKALQQMLLHNQHVDAYHRTVAKGKELSGQMGEITLLQNQLDIASSARELQPLEVAFRQAEKNVSELRLAIRDEQEELNRLNEQGDSVRMKFAENEQLQIRVEEMNNRWLVLEQQSVQMERLETDNRLILQLNREIPQLSAKLPQLRTEKESAEAELHTAKQNQSVIRYMLGKMLDAMTRKEIGLKTFEPLGTEAVQAAETVYEEWLDTYRADLAIYFPDAPWEPEHILRMMKAADEAANVESAQDVRKAKIAAIEQRIRELDGEITKLSNLLQSKQTELEGKQHAVLDAMKLLAELVGSAEPELHQYYELKKTLQRQLNELRSTIESNAKAFSDWQLKSGAKKATVAKLSEQLTASSLVSEAARLAFESALSESLFADATVPDESMQRYGQALRLIPSINEWVKQISTYHALVEQNQSESVRLKELLNGNLEPYDTVQPEQELTERRQRLAAMMTALGAVRKDIEQLSAQIGQYQSSVDRSKAQEQQLIPAKELKEVLEGGTRQISFENHILMYHFREILHYANLRLMRMVHNRYHLKLSDEVSKNTEALDLYVFDHQTGQNRPVHTLSGGEKFMASLALGLGATDSIHASRGGIEMNMMFIDEGFGTLDEGKLEEAVRVLLEISEGRVVGIISHRNELKERMPARIEVSNRDGISSLKTICERF